MPRVHVEYDAVLHAVTVIADVACTQFMYNYIHLHMHTAAYGLFYYGCMRLIALLETGINLSESDTITQLL